MRVHVQSRSLECNEEKKEKKSKIEPWIVMERKHNAADFSVTLLYVLYALHTHPSVQKGPNGKNSSPCSI